MAHYAVRPLPVEEHEQTADTELVLVLVVGQLKEGKNNAKKHKRVLPTDVPLEPMEASESGSAAFTTNKSTLADAGAEGGKGGRAVAESASCLMAGGRVPEHAFRGQHSGADRACRVLNCCCLKFATGIPYRATGIQ
ncbi:hypothetical protein PF003_g12416 [Phytophthora fragariae]|nr:hypothetical protein PF003_g12416 [Phytophthora fragariae]